MTATAEPIRTSTSAAPILWPERDTHTVEYASLDPSVPEDLQPLVPAALQLAKLGDALRSLQLADGSHVAPEASRQLAASAAELMQELAGSPALTPEAADLIRLRADALVNGTPAEQAARQEAELAAPQPLTVLCGPLCTWRQKSKIPLHGVVVATQHKASDRLLAEVDAHAAQALATVEAQLGIAGLAVAGVYPIQVVDLIACGGEANTFPKHFAYFLPEDEGIVDRETPNKKTILFRNGYRLRFTQISARLGDALLDGPRLAPGVDPAPILITWLRGHDIGHGVTLQGGGQVGSPDVGHEPWMALQEAISDVYGFLMAVTPEWLELMGASADDVGAIFMGELLHYLRRGPWLWGDAGAAFVTLSFLEQRGFVEIDGDGVVRWDGERLVEGMKALAKELSARVVTAPDAATVQALLDEYCDWERDSGAKRVVEALRTQLASVPTALAYA
jgi:hypothetical protein